jgi:hypothetical protein
MTPGGNTRYDPNDPELDQATPAMTAEERITFLREVIATSTNWARYYGVASPLAASEHQYIIDKAQAELDALTQEAEAAEWRDEQDTRESVRP